MSIHITIAISIPEGVSTSRESWKSSPCNEDGGVSLEAPPSCGTDGGASPNSDPDGEASPSGGEASFRGVVSKSGVTNGTSFTDEQLELFEKCLEEEYDLFVDADYVRWLEMHHPETLPPDRYTLTSANDDVATSIVEEFTYIPPETPVTITDGEVVTPKQTGSSGRTTISKYLVCPKTATPSGIGHKFLPCARLLTSAESREKKDCGGTNYTSISLKEEQSQ